MAKQLYCSPQVESVAKRSGTCFSLEYLRLIASLYNKAYPDDRVDTVKYKTKNGLWKEINKRLESRCSNEACWLEQPFMNAAQQKLVKSFRPKKPKSWNQNPNEWLNTYDILDVMKQYELKDKKYKFVGVFPVDFASRSTATGTCISQEMCSLDIPDMWKRKVAKIGVVFNLDKSYQSGSHWVSCFIGLDPKQKNFGVFYYDSVASKPPKEIDAFMKETHEEITKLHSRHSAILEYKTNKIQRQFKDTECGIFSIMFQILMMKHKFDDVCKNMGYDNDVEKYRNVLYRPG